MAPQQPAPDPMTETALRSLRDIALPEPVSWVPQTWGWALVAALAAAIVIVFGLRWLRRYRADAYRRDALRLLVSAEEKIRNPATRRDGIHDLTELLKRTALAGWRRKDVAAMSGSSWVRFLDAHDDRHAGTTLQKLLDDFEYRDDRSLDTLPANVGDEMALAARGWIERHHVSA